MIDCSHAGAEPHSQGRGGSEIGVQDDETGAEGRVLEGVFVVRAIVGRPRDGSVLAR